MEAWCRHIFFYGGGRYVGIFLARDLIVPPISYLCVVSNASPMDRMVDSGS